MDASPDQAAPPPSDDDRLFVRIAVRSGLLTRERGDEVLDALGRGEATCAGAVCVAKGWLTEAQVRTVGVGAPGAERPAGAPEDRRAAFDAYVRLKQAVQRGAVDEALALSARLAQDPEFARAAAAQAERALARRAVLEARAHGGQVVRCAGCNAPVAAGARECPRCRAALGTDRVGGVRRGDGFATETSTPSG